MVDGFVIFKKNFETYRTRVPWDVTRRIIAALRDVGANAVTDAKRAETRTVIIAESFMTMPSPEVVTMRKDHWWQQQGPENSPR